MKKTLAFVAVALTLTFAVQGAFAQIAPVVESTTGIRGVALRTYCAFSTLFGANNNRCFNQANGGQIINTASVGAIGIGQGTAPTPAAGSTGGNTGGQTASIGGFAVQTAPQVIERTVVVQGTPGPQGPAGPAGPAGSGASGAFVNVPQVFWNGGGGSASPSFTTTSVSPLPGGALPGQVLTTNASGTPEWQYITIPSASNTPSVLGSLANFFAENGLNLATTSTSTTLRLGGDLTQDTSINQGAFNFGLSRNGFSFLNQGTTTLPDGGVASVTPRFIGFNAEESDHALAAGIHNRFDGVTPTFSVYARNTTGGALRNAFLDIDHYVQQFGVGTGDGETFKSIRFDDSRGTWLRSNSSSTNVYANLQMRPDGLQQWFVNASDTINRNASSTGISFGNGTGITFHGGEGASSTYTFPQLDGAFDSFLSTDGAGQIRFRTLADVLASTSSTTLVALPVWTTQGNTGTDSSSNFLGTVDAEDLVIRTDNVERARVTSEGNVGIGTSTPSARLSVQGAGDTQPIAYFQNGAQTYARFANSPSAFSQTYDMGVESVGGTFNIFDVNAGRNRMSINRNGLFQIYDRLAVGSYDFGLGNVGDAGFGNSGAAYMRYAQRQHIGDATLELFDVGNQLSTRISQSAVGTPTEFNRTNRDIDFRVAGQTDNNLFFADASTNSVGIGTSVLPQKLTVAGGVQLNNNLVIKRPSGISEILFDNTNGTGDFRIRGEANDLLIQGGGGKNLQLGAWHGMVLQGGLTSHSIPAFETGTWAQFNTMIKNPNDSVGLIVRGNNTQTQDLLQLQNGAGTNLGVFTASGNLGLGTALPSTRLEVNSGTLNDSGLALTQLTSASPELGTALKFLTVDALGKVTLSGLDSSVFATTSVAGVNGNVQFNQGGVLAANPNFTWDNALSRLGIGTASPTETLDVGGNINVSSGSAYMYNGVPVMRALTSSGNFFFGPSGNMTMTGTDNFTIGGPNVLGQNTTGTHNIGIGSAVLVRNTSGSSNVAIGNSAMYFNVSGTFNTALGFGSLYSNETGNQNTANGAYAMQRNTSGSQNTAQGSYALFNNTTGSANIAYGSYAHHFNENGNNNTVIGTEAMFNSQTGNNNTVLGYRTGYGLVSGSNNTIIGANVSGIPSNATNTVIIADGSGNRRITVDAVGNTGIGLGTTTPTHRLHVFQSGTGRVARFQNTAGSCYIDPLIPGFTCSSDQNLKKDIRAIDQESSLELFAQLKPVSYLWNVQEDGAARSFGFIAQEVEQLYPHLVTVDENGMKSLAYDTFIPITIKAVQDLNTALGDLSKETTGERFAESPIFKRIVSAFEVVTVAFKNLVADKATVKELCLPKSNGEVICLTGDQVAQIAASAGVTTMPVVSMVEDTVPNPTPIDQVQVDQVPSGDTTPADTESVPEVTPNADIDPLPIIEETLVSEVVTTPEPALPEETQTE